MECSQRFTYASNSVKVQKRKVFDKIIQRNSNFYQLFDKLHVRTNVGMQMKCLKSFNYENTTKSLIKPTLTTLSQIWF